MGEAYRVDLTLRVLTLAEFMLTSPPTVPLSGSFSFRCNPRSLSSDKGMKNELAQRALALALRGFLITYPDSGAVLLSIAGRFAYPLRV